MANIICSANETINGRDLGREFRELEKTFKYVLVGKCEGPIYTSYLIVFMNEEKPRTAFQSTINELQKLCDLQKVKALLRFNLITKPMEYVTWYCFGELDDDAQDERG